MNKPDIMRVTFDQSPHLSEATRDMAVGDRIEFEVTATLKARDQEGVDFTIEAVVPEGYELDEEATEPQTMGGISQSDAMQTALSMTVRKKGNSGIGPNVRT